VGFVIFLLVLAFIGWAAFTQVCARQQTSVSCPYDVATARALAARCFGRSWAPVNGKGDLNYKPRMRARAPTISVSFDASESGGSEVDVWCSAFTKRYGLLEHGQLVWRKKRALARALTAMPPGSSPSAGSALSYGGAAAPESARLEATGPQPEQVAASPANGVCLHDPRNGMKFGQQIKTKGDPPYQYREFWHVTSCAKCGAELSRQGDEYYGDDMADIHWKWRQ
jgi:hypothetical protein